MMRPLALTALALTALLPGSASAEPTLRLLSMNVWGAPYVSPEREPRLEGIIAAIRDLDVDIVTLQEVWIPSDAARLSDELRAAGLEHSVHFAEGGGSGLWVGSRLPIAGTRFERFVLGSEPSIPWHLDWVSDKGFARVRIETPAGPLDVVNTHLQASYTIGEYPFIQLAQARQLARGLTATDATPLVVAGDLNAVPSSAAFQSLVAEGCLTPAAPDFDVDAVLMRPGVRAVSARRVLDEPVTLSNGSVRPLSDHPAWLVELAVGAPGGTCAVSAPAADVDGFLADEHALAHRWLWTHRALTLLLLVGGFVTLRHLRHRRRWVLGGALGVSTVLLAVWLGYLGWGRGPRMLRAIEGEQAGRARPS